MSKATFDCPRRVDRYWYALRMTNEQLSDYIDAALDPDGHPVHDDDGKLIAPLDHWRRDGTCSYCGSMSPERLFEAIENGAEIGPTDKPYKVYVEKPAGKFYTLHLNRQNAARLRTLFDENRVNVGYPGRFYSGLWLATAAVTD